MSPFTGECTVINPFQCWSFTATLSVERGTRTVSAVVTDVEGRGTTVSVGGIVDYCRKGQFDSEQSTPGKDPGVNALAGPSREVQGNRCHEIDGCSGPLGLGLANDPTPLAVCNEAATHFGVGTQPPEEHFVHGLSSAFDLPCNHHDVCYQTCVPVAGLSDAARESAWRAAWHRCNGDHLARAQQVCRRAFPSPLCTSSPSAACLLAGGCGKYLQERALCFGSASIAFQAVESEKGYERFRERQADSCAG